MNELFDIVRLNKQISAPMDLRRGFYFHDVESLDASDLVPAGSTEARLTFHVSSFTFRGA
jgi:hypothetical protein